MSSSFKWTLIGVAVLIIAVGVLVMRGPEARVQAHGEAVAVEPAPVATRAVPDLVGVWEGTWEDTVFTWAHGTMSWEITQDRTDLSATGVIDMTVFSDPWGLGVQSGTGSGTIAGNVLTFDFEGDLIGTGSGTVTNNTATGSGNVGMPLGFGGFNFQGTVTDTVIRGTFDFPTGGSGKARMTKQSPVEPSSWGGIKARYRDKE